MTRGTLEGEEHHAHKSGKDGGTPEKESGPLLSSMITLNAFASPPYPHLLQVGFEDGKEVLRKCEKREGMDRNEIHDSSSLVFFSN